MLGADHPDTLSSRRGLAYYLGETGDRLEALAVEDDVLLRAERAGDDLLLRSVRWLRADLAFRVARASKGPVPRELREAIDAAPG